MLTPTDISEIPGKRWVSACTLLMHGHVTSSERVSSAHRLTHGHVTSSERVGSAYRLTHGHVTYQYYIAKLIPIDRSFVLNSNSHLTQIVT